MAAKGRKFFCVDHGIELEESGYADEIILDCPKCIEEYIDGDIESRAVLSIQNGIVKVGVHRWDDYQGEGFNENISEAN